MRRLKLLFYHITKSKRKRRKDNIISQAIDDHVGAYNNMSNYCVFYDSKLNCLLYAYDTYDRYLRVLYGGRN